MVSEPRGKIRKVVEILDSVDYSNYTSDEVEGYLNYIQGSRTDEDKLIYPILLREFLEGILGFRLGRSIYTKESIPDSGDIPDYIPIDSRTHPFVLDAKGTDTKDLTQYQGQIKKYMKRHSNRLEYGILTNMRDVDIFEGQDFKKLDAYSFSFKDLYGDYKEDAKTILEQENTKHFLKFIKKFHYRKLSFKEKLERVKSGTPWTGEEKLNISVLTNQLRYVVEVLHEDVKHCKSSIEKLKEYDPERARNIAQEIENISTEISSGRELQKATTETLEEILSASTNSLYEQSLNTFFYRTAYFTMTRLLLVRMWEDIGFINQTLYDGGLAKWYERFNHKIQQVLEYAFRLAAEKYEWLFQVENNYTWYEPSNRTLIKVLYELSNFNLGKLNRDVLGTIYEEYIDKVDKKNKGQYYTPREIVDFIWDRVGFSEQEAYFKKQVRGKRKPVKILDPASGSGGFLVEAARRIREESNLSLDEFEDLLELRSSIFAGLFGAEISTFPYYITEVNLLIQLTPIVKRMIELKEPYQKEHLPLPVLRVDALSLHNKWNNLLEENKGYEPDELRDLLPLDSRKKKIWQLIKEELAGNFDYCCANPPYIGEKGRKELFRNTRKKRFPYWNQYYQGKMDYFYWFIILGLSKLKEGGKLGFVTTLYWPTAEGASILRKHILKNAKIKEMIFFNETKLFEYAKGQHNMVFILEKRSNQESEQAKASNRIKIVKVVTANSKIPGNSISDKLQYLTKHIQKHIDNETYQDDYIHIHWSGVKQGELPDGAPWYELKIPPSDIKFTQDLENKGDPLDKLCYIKQGVVSGADKLAKKKMKELLPKERIRKYNLKKGDGIFILSENEKDELDLSEAEEELLKPTYKNSDIKPYFTHTKRRSDIFLLYVTKGVDIDNYPKIKQHLKRFKEILMERRECKQGKIPWYSLQWPRDEKLLSAMKIVTPRWGKDIKPFGLQTGAFYENSDVNLFVDRSSTREDLLYILGLLNSDLIKLWMKKKAKQKGLTRQSILKKIPIARINFENNKEERLHNLIVEKVKNIRKDISFLSDYSKYLSTPSLLQLSPEKELPDFKLNITAILDDLPPNKLYSIRTHPSLSIVGLEDGSEANFNLRQIGDVELTLENPQIQLKARNRSTLAIQGPKDLLDLLSDLLTECRGMDWKDIKRELLLPKSVSTFLERKEQIVSAVNGLIGKIEETQEKINSMVYEIYGIEQSRVKD